MRKSKYNGLAIALAWPQTQCKQAGAWYDIFAHLLGLNQRGYYKVGHAAIILVDIRIKECLYFDFGRYHAPHGKGRVRSATTDHDLKISVCPVIENGKIVNLKQILIELVQNPSTHGSGSIYGAQIPIDFARSYKVALGLQSRDFVSYGPFVLKGTNCSRFVNKILRSGAKKTRTKIALRLPWMLTPTPLWNLKAIKREITKVDGDSNNKDVSKYSELRFQA